MENSNNSSSKQFYINFLDKLVTDNIITQFCKNKLIDMLNSTNTKTNYQFKKTLQQPIRVKRYFTNMKYIECLRQLYMILLSTNNRNLYYYYVYVASHGLSINAYFDRKESHKTIKHLIDLFVL